jgi:hypothetical protein
VNVLNCSLIPFSVVVRSDEQESEQSSEAEGRRNASKAPGRVDVALRRLEEVRCNRWQPDWITSHGFTAPELFYHRQPVLRGEFWHRSMPILEAHGA